MPSYEKFLKEILTNNRNFDDIGTISLTEECSAIIQNNLTLKLKDSESFSIICFIGNTIIHKAMCDIGVIFSLMPLSIRKRLDLGELKPTRMSL